MSVFRPSICVGSAHPARARNPPKAILGCLQPNTIPAKRTKSLTTLRYLRSSWVPVQGGGGNAKLVRCLWASNSLVPHPRADLADEKLQIAQAAPGGWQGAQLVRLHIEPPQIRRPSDGYKLQGRRQVLSMMVLRRPRPSRAEIVHKSYERFENGPEPV